MENTNLKQMIYLEVALFQETSLNVFFPTKPWIGVWNQPRELHKPEGMVILRVNLNFDGP